MRAAGPGGRPRRRIASVTVRRGVALLLIALLVTRLIVLLICLLRITLRGIAADGIILAVALAGWVAPTGWVDRRRGVLIGAAVRILCVLVLGVLVLG
ncbi:hypothetical protein AAY23_10202, partial [Frankia casuarinae]